jgi:putative redox protein
MGGAPQGGKEAAMATETVRLDWIEKQLFLLRDRDGFPVVMTEPQGVHGSDLLPLSLIGCACWDVAAILQKQRQPLGKLEVTAESVQDDDPPWRFRSIRIHYRVVGHGLNADLVRRAIELSETRYCAVYATLRDALQISSEVEIVEQ